MRIDETVHLSPFREAWKETFLSEKRKLQPLFGEEVSIEHIGSTSVEGMVAKPVIDMMIGLQKLSVDAETESRLHKVSYAAFGEAGVPGRRYYRKREGDHINLQVTVMHSNVWTDNVLFRDYLRMHQADRDKYSNYKQAILDKGIGTLLAYSDAKSGLIFELMERARKWDQQVRQGLSRRE